MADVVALHDRLLDACRKQQAKGQVIASCPVLDGECCPLQAVALEEAGSFGLMAYPWEAGPCKMLGISREQAWNFLCGFDGKEPGAYQMSGRDGVPSDLQFYTLGVLMREELL